MSRYYSLVSYKGLNYEIIEVTAENIKEAYKIIDSFFINKYGKNDQHCKIVSFEKV